MTKLLIQVEKVIIDTKKLQKEVLDNKRRHNFNKTDIKLEQLLLCGEVNELFKGWLKQDDDNINEELADVGIFCWVYPKCWEATQ